MNQNEKEIFHKNYEYMWDKLNTNHYYVKCDTGDSQALHAHNIQGRDVLPSYTICSKCMNHEYEPSLNIVKKIVNFYNLNLSPEVNTLQFLHENLALTDRHRYRNRTLFDQRFLGVFYGYYPSASISTSAINGAMLQIYKEDDILSAVLVTGIRSDEELYGKDLNRLFSQPVVRKSDFDYYFQTRDMSNQRCYYYQGNAELTNQSFMLTLRGVDSDQRKLIMALNIDCFPSQGNRAYSGGLAFILTSNDGPFDVRFFKMGIINVSTNIKISLHNKTLAKLLEINETGNEINLTSTADRVWYEFILEQYNVLEKK